MAAPPPRTVTPDSAEGLALAALGRALASQDLSSAFSEAKTALRESVHRDPIDALIVTCLGSAWLFYVAEREDNPRVQSFWDALVFCSTSLSVGYANSFAVTTAGKAIASALMTIGPSMAAKALEAPAAAQRERERDAIESQRALTDRIDALVSRIDAIVTRAAP